MERHQYFVELYISARLIQRNIFLDSKTVTPHSIPNLVSDDELKSPKLQNVGQQNAEFSKSQRPKSSNYLNPKNQNAEFKKSEYFFFF